MAQRRCSAPRCSASSGLPCGDQAQWIRVRSAASLGVGLLSNPDCHSASKAGDSKPSGGCETSCRPQMTHSTVVFAPYAQTACLDAHPKACNSLWCPGLHVAESWAAHPAPTGLGAALCLCFAADRGAKKKKKNVLKTHLLRRKHTRGPRSGKDVSQALDFKESPGPS